MSTAGVERAPVDEVGVADPTIATGPVGKLASQIARAIETDIIAQDLPVGHNLGSALELRTRYGISRAVLREVVRLVEHHKMARMRRGPNGGLLVAAPDAGPATDAVVIYLEYIGTTIEDLMYARQLLEPLAASLAAQNITETGIGRLRATLTEEIMRRDEPGVFAQENLHVTLGELSGNPVLQLFVEILTRLTTRYAHTARRLTPTEVEQDKDTTLHWHSEIIDLVVDGDGGRASSRLADHLADVSGWLQDDRSRRPLRRRAVGADLAASPNANLAEVVAGQIYDEIVSGGFQIGTVIGSESDLITRYQVSRAFLREAVRLLEFHSVARMRRGPGGGLVVTAPDPQASIDGVTLYLDHRKVGASDLLAVRESLELGILKLVMDRGADPDVIFRLESVLRHELPCTDWDRFGSDRFHTELAGISANPVLDLLLRMITALWRHHTATSAPTDDGVQGNATEVERIHRLIFEAIRDGDEGLARHRMRRHLEALTAWYH
jgi:DNA-binding FadR family transcriptional regulator